MKLFSKNSNLCDHCTTMSQMEGQTTYRNKAALCVASCSKNQASNSHVMAAKAIP